MAWVLHERYCYAFWVGWAVSLAGEVGVTDNSLLIGMTAPFSGPNGAYGLDMKMVINAYFPPA
jgi:hypothetical protein